MDRGPRSRRPTPNPYAAPASDLGPDPHPDPWIEPTEEEPPAKRIRPSTSLLTKLVDALRLMGEHFPVVIGLILCASVPLKLLAFLIIRSGWIPEESTVPLGLILLFAITMLHLAMVYRAGEPMVHGQPVSISDALLAGPAHWWSLLVMRCVTIGLTLGGLTLLIVPGCLLAAQFVLVDPILVLESDDGRSRWDSLRRSRELSRSRRGSLVLTWFCLAGLQAVAATVCYGIYQRLFEPRPRADQILGFLGIQVSLDLCITLCGLIVVLAYVELSGRTDRADQPD